jgi:methionine biosynthesis protein MetW
MSSIGENIVIHKIRYDHEIIADLIEENSKVLDIGCGNGELLYHLKRFKKSDCRGIEISQESIAECLTKGLSVIHGDANSDLNLYPDASFDYAILGQTIQAMNHPNQILDEMLRIAKYAIVSLPNFANYKNRLHLLFKGTMPVNKTIPFEWYETPNIHFCSIRDFENLCFKKKLLVEKKIFLTAKHKLISIMGNEIISNLIADYGIFLIKKKEFCFTNQEEYVQNQTNQKTFDQLNLANKVFSQTYNKS